MCTCEYTCELGIFNNNNNRLYRSIITTNRPLLSCIPTSVSSEVKSDRAVVFDAEDAIESDTGVIVDAGHAMADDEMRPVAPPACRQIQPGVAVCSGA